MPNHRSPDPKRNAGISLTGAQIENLDDYRSRAGLPSRSAVIDRLIQRGMPILWADLLLEKSRAKPAPNPKIMQEKGLEFIPSPNGGALVKRPQP